MYKNALKLVEISQSSNDHKYAPFSETQQYDRDKKQERQRNRERRKKDVHYHYE